MSTSKRLIKAFSDAIPLGPHPDPHTERVQVRLDFVQDAADHIDWLDKGIKEWRDAAQTATSRRNAVAATARIAIGHLQAVLNKPRTHDEQIKADAAAREWLLSIGSEPT